MTKKKEKIKKGDHERVLLTDTFPVETPIIFSNDGFYNHCRNNKNHTSNNPYKIKPLFDKIIVGADQNTIPYTYKIRKNEISPRTLSLLHPSWQFKCIDFYKDYSNLICYYCSTSPISIRFPKKVASSVFYKNKYENINKYKNTAISTTKTDYISKNPGLYFSYGGFHREHKFFGSNNFLELEKKYHCLWTLDVSKCFQSIYTHSISWALKSKSFVKKHLNHYTFGDEFDALMRSAKHNETNGIVIGPEISRIFAELIFQDIDCKIISSLEKKKIYFDKEYTMRRYVDDIFIFSKNTVIAEEVARVVSAQLFEYNLHLNDTKLKKITRPFFTPQSKTIFEVNYRIEEFSDKFLENRGKKNKCIPKAIKSPNNLKNNFIHSIKSISYGDHSGYSVISGYIIASLARKVIEVIDSGTTSKVFDEDKQKKYYKALLCLLETMFFFYTVEPSVTSSYKLSRALVLSARYAKEKLQEYEASFIQGLLQLFIQYYESNKFSKESQYKETAPLETVNILLALSDLGENYLLPYTEIERIFKINDSPSYFEIVSCLYYIKSHKTYDILKDKLEKVIEKKLKTVNIIENSETIYILLDIISCPYVNTILKTKILTDLNTKIQIDLSGIGDANQQLVHLQNNPWFIKWDKIDLLTLLEKKELSAAY